jgi:hypothetical protein
MTFGGIQIKVSPWAMVPGKPIQVKRPWRERLFSRPWRPWVKTRLVIPTVPGMLQLVGLLAGSPVGAGRSEEA